MKIQSIKWDGQPITKPGVYSDVPIEAYHQQTICDGPSVSSSGLRRVLEVNGGSPAHFFAEWSGNPGRREREEKKHFVIGRAVHHLMLGQPYFSKSFIIRPPELPDEEGVVKPWNGNRNVCKKWLAEQPKGRTVLADDDVDSIRGMAIELGRHPEVRGVETPNGFHGPLNGLIERSFFWKDKATGLWLKARPDAIPTDSGDYADLKTTTSVQYRDLMFAVTDFAYHQQAALIAEGSLICAGIEMSSFTLVFVEKKYPWPVRPVLIKPDDITLGRQQNRLALGLIARCMKTKRWPGPGDDRLDDIDITDMYRDRAKRDVDEQLKALADEARRDDEAKRRARA